MSVQVIDYITGKLVHTINGIKNPHSVLYRQDLDRIYITHGGAGLLRIYDGRSYEQIKTIDPLPDADSIAYHPAPKHLYAHTGGKDPDTDSAHVKASDAT